MKDDSYGEIKHITDSIYSGSLEKPTAEIFLKVLNKHGIKLRQKDGVFDHVTYSIPTSAKDCILIGLRYKKKDGTFTEDHFLFQKDVSVRKFYKRKIEKVLPEYTGAHKKQSDFHSG